MRTAQFLMVPGDERSFLNWPNLAASVDAPIASKLPFLALWRRATVPHRWTMDA